MPIVSAYKTFIDARKSGDEVVVSDFTTLPTPFVGTLKYRITELPLNVITSPSLTDAVYVRAVDPITHVPTGPVFTSVMAPASPAPGHFQINSVDTFNLGTIIFNGLDGGTTLEIIVTGRGSLVFASDIDNIQDEITDARSTFPSVGDRIAAIVGGSSVGGVSGNIQYNHLGAFTGDSTFNWDQTNHRLGIGLVSPTEMLTVGAGAGFTVNGSGVVRAVAYRGLVADGSSISLLATAGVFTDGGAVTIQSGDGASAFNAGGIDLAAGSSSSGLAGNISLVGGGSTAASNGGEISLEGGSSVGGLGGDIVFTPGIGTTNGSILLNGFINIPAGAATGGVLTSDSSGFATWSVSASLTGGVGSPTYKALVADGSSVSLLATNGVSTNGGTVSINAGNGGSPSHNGGQVSIVAGDSVGGTSGNVVIDAGNGTSSAGGHVIVNGGSSGSTGGDIRLVPGTGPTAGTILLDGKIKIPAGASATYVLTSDGVGVATWAPAAAGVTINRVDYVVGTPSGSYSGSTTVYDLPWAYVIGSGKLFAYYNGLLETVSVDYAETSTTSVTYSNPLTGGSNVSFVSF